MSTQFALDESSRLVHINEASRGLACHCRCVVCEEALIARKGEVREHHFAHASNKAPCDASHESLLHRYAKQVILDAGGLVVPADPAALEALGVDDADADRSALTLNCASLNVEVAVGDFRVDLLGATADGVAFAIEVAYSSFCDRPKREGLEALSLPTLEIDLRSFTPNGFDPDEVRDAVVARLEGKQWISPLPPPILQPEPVMPALPWPTAALVAPAAPIAAPAKKAPLPEHRYTISGRWVFVKEFPNGDIAVKAGRYDPDLVSLIGSICRAKRGRYNPKYKTWNVPRWAAALIHEELAAAEASFKIGVVDAGAMAHG